MKRVPVLLAIIFLILSTCASAEKMFALCSPTDYVTVRESPSTKGQYAGYLECGDSVEVTGVTRTDKQGRKWMEVIGFEGGGWVCETYLQDSPVFVGRITVYVCANGRTALRRSPNGKRTKWVSNGQELTALAMSDDWVYTTSGYVRRDCVEVYGGTVE